MRIKQPMLTSITVAATALLVGCGGKSPSEADVFEAWQIGVKKTYGFDKLVHSELREFKCESSTETSATCASSVDVTRMYSFNAMPELSPTATEIAQTAIAAGHSSADVFSVVSTVAGMDVDFRVCDPKSIRPSIQLRKEFDFAMNADGSWTKTAERELESGCNVFGL